jgi:hypothetical protein
MIAVGFLRKAFLPAAGLYRPAGERAQQDGKYTNSGCNGTVVLHCDWAPV